MPFVAHGTIGFYSNTVAATAERLISVYSIPVLYVLLTCIVWLYRPTVNLQVWPEVKRVNPDRSVCELGSLIGRMWRELGDAEKQPYFDSFTNAKVRVPFSAVLVCFFDRPVSCFITLRSIRCRVHWFCPISPNPISPNPISPNLISPNPIS